MSKFKETICKHYICAGECELGKEAAHKGYCQHCTYYEPRANMKYKNRKKEYNEKLRIKTHMEDY